MDKPYCVLMLSLSIFCAFFTSTSAAAKSLQSCPTLCDPIDGSPPGSPIPGILQARTLEWVAISFSSAWKWKVKVKTLSRVRLLVTLWTEAYQAPPSMGFSRQESLPLLLFKSAFQNSGKVMEAEVCFLQIRNGGHRKSSMPRSPTGSCSVSDTWKENEGKLQGSISDMNSLKFWLPHPVTFLI